MRFKVKIQQVFIVVFSNISFFNFDSADNFSFVGDEVSICCEDGVTDCKVVVVHYCS